MNSNLNEIPEITPEAVAEAIVRARRERSDFIAAALSALVRRLRLPRRVAAPGRPATC